VNTDGRFVVFISSADGLVPEDNNGRDDVFVYDRQSAQLQRIAVSASTLTVSIGGPAISGDGQFVAFASNDSTLVRATPTTESMSSWLTASATASSG